MKKLMMLVVMGMAAVPSVWATIRPIRVQAKVPAPTWLSQLLPLFQ